MESKLLFEAANVNKIIEGHSVLENVSFKLFNHMTIAITGKNGSGKSTLLKMLAGIYEPSQGSIMRHSKKIAYVPEHFPEKIRFKVEEYLRLMTSFHRFKSAQVDNELREYSNMFQIEEFLDKPLKECSKGNKQKVGIIQSLLMNPDVLLLDEPLTGLDSKSQQHLIELLGKIRNETMVIFTTHENVMAEKLATENLNIESGKVFFTEKVQKLKRLIKVEFTNKEVFKEFGLTGVEIVGNKALLKVDAEKSDQFLINLLNNNCTVLEVKEMRM